MLKIKDKDEKIDAFLRDYEKEYDENEGESTENDNNETSENEEEEDNNSYKDSSWLFNS